MGNNEHNRTFLIAIDVDSDIVPITSHYSSCMLDLRFYNLGVTEIIEYIKN